MLTQRSPVSYNRYIKDDDEEDEDDKVREIDER